jgi:hypothetical protein
MNESKWEKEVTVEEILNLREEMKLPTIPFRKELKSLGTITVERPFETSEMILQGVMKELQTITISVKEFVPWFMMSGVGWLYKEEVKEITRFKGYLSDFQPISHYPVDDDGNQTGPEVPCCCNEPPEVQFTITPVEDGNKPD